VEGRNVELNRKHGKQEKIMKKAFRERQKDEKSRE
jgi:hypothetical protein